jgi:hypothetical protein
MRGFEWRVVKLAPARADAHRHVPAQLPDEEHENRRDAHNLLPASALQRKLQALKGMGFSDEAALRRALQLADGDENAAAELLLAGH